MEGIAPSKITVELQPKAKKLSARIERLETKFIMDNYDNVLGPGVFMLLCNQYHYPILTDQIRAIMKKAPEKFRNHPYVTPYISTEEENMVRLQPITTLGKFPRAFLLSLANLPFMQPRPRP